MVVRKWWWDGGEEVVVVVMVGLVSIRKAKRKKILFCRNEWMDLLLYLKIVLRLRQQF